MPIGSSLGAMFSNPAFGPIATGSLAGLGEVGNLIGGIQSQKELSAEQKQRDYVNNLTPAQLSQMAISGEAPINQSLLQNVRNDVQGDLASRGLAQSPGLFTAEESQAIAPIEQANYQTSMNALLQKLGLPLEYGALLQRLLPGQANVTPAIALFLQQLKAMQSGGSTDTTGLTGPNLDTLSNFIFGTPSTGSSCNRRFGHRNDAGRPRLVELRSWCLMGGYFGSVARSLGGVGSDTFNAKEMLRQDTDTNRAQKLADIKEQLGIKGEQQRQELAPWQTFNAPRADGGQDIHYYNPLTKEDRVVSSSPGLPAPYSDVHVDTNGNLAGRNNRTGNVEELPKQSGVGLRLPEKRNRNGRFGPRWPTYWNQAPPLEWAGWNRAAWECGMDR